MKKSKAPPADVWFKISLTVTSGAGPYGSRSVRLCPGGRPVGVQGHGDSVAPWELLLEGDGGVSVAGTACRVLETLELTV